MSAPPSSRWSEPLRGAVLGGAIVLVLGLWVYPVTPGGDSPSGPIQNDAAHYLAMARGSVTDAPAPFSFRIGVPLLAQYLPVAPEVTFRLVTWICLAWVCALTYLLGRRLGYAPAPLALAVVAGATTPAWVYQLENPYLTDGIGLLAITASLSAWFAGAFGVALLMLVLGPLFRETVAVTAGLWIRERPRWKVVVALAASALSLAVVRKLPGMPPAPGLFESAQHVLERKGLVRIFGDALGSWHALWFLAAAGLYLASKERRQQLLLPLALLLLSATGFSLIALNTQRMYFFAFPAMVLALAELFERAWSERPRLLVAFLVLLVFSVPFWSPAWPFGILLAKAKALRNTYGVVLLIAAIPLLRLALRRPSPLSYSTGRARR
ncbi:hypothetical protein [Hyalangium sp.]|uniref:hypothetical protein n=1 Tax=Hyalangium sp. TaxID=2028555 RepID=UPI002D69922B|nr:hypothetical protein [Hyalangium sp.]HYH99073.1 hypothetical protein [Hyalangium sp.]